MALAIVFRIPVWQGTIYDWALLIFLITAAVGVWSSYDSSAALNKYFSLLGAAAIFWLIRSQTLSNYWVTAGVLSAWSIVIGGHFLLSQDWVQFPADLPFLNALGEGWMVIRPNVTLRFVHPNIAGGLLAALIPFIFFAAQYATRRGKRGLSVLYFGTLAFCLATLIMTSSRAALIALVLASFVWLFWIGMGWAARRWAFSQTRLFLGIVLFAGLASILFLLTTPQTVVAVINRLPGHGSNLSRVALFEGAAHLVPDYPLIGGGLASFPGLYSEYILNTPFFIVGYANLFLDILIEIGIPGFIALLVLLVGSLIRVFSRILRSQSRSKRLTAARWGAGLGLLILLIHGLVDDPFFGMEGTALLLLLPGLALGSTPMRTKRGAEEAVQRSRVWGYALGAVLVGIFLIGALTVTQMIPVPLPQIPILQANLGAIQMSRVSLIGWPTGQWDEGTEPSKYLDAYARFQRALNVDPDQSTALYRLGLLLMRERDYESAEAYLSQALSDQPSHPGIQKSLGFTLVWLGDFEKAKTLLTSFNGLENELANYIPWWDRQGRADLSEKAAQMLEFIEPEKVRQRSSTGVIFERTFFVV